MRLIKRFAVANTLASILLLLTFAYLSFERFHAAEIRENNANLERCIRIFGELLSHKGVGFSIADGKLLAGSYIINGNFEVPDKVREIFGGTATVFMGDRRVSTNILLEDGRRAVGTRLEGPAYDAIFKQGKSFHGETKILGVPYLTVYDPIRDSNGKIIGALYVGLKKSDFLAQHALLKTQLLVILLGLSIVFISFTIKLNSLVKKSERIKEADHRFLQTLIDTIPTPVFYKDVDGKYLGCNKAYELFIGLPRERLTGKTVFDIAPPHLAEIYHKADDELFLKQGVQVYESAAKYADGIQHEVIYYKATFPAADGTLGGLIGCMLDISERKRAETDLRESRQHLLDIIQFYPDATMVIDIHGKVTAWNRAMEELSGVRAEEMLGRGDYEYAIPFYGERRPILIDLAIQPEKEIEGKYARIERRGNTLFGEAYIHNARGEELYFHGTASALRNTSGEIIGAIESIRDITIRKRTEEEVLFKNIILSTQQDVSPDGILVIDESGVIISYNRRFVEMWEFPPELTDTRDDVLLLQFAVTKSSDPESFLARVKYLHEHRDEKSREEITLKDGRVFDRYSAPMTGTDGKHHGRVWYFRDITEQKTAENLLVESEAFLLNILDSIQDGISIIDTELRIVRQNLSLDRYFLDKHPIVGRKCFEVYYGRTDPCEFCPCLATIRSGEPSSKIFSTVENDTEVWREIFTFPIFDSEKSRVTGVIAYRRDITSRKRAEEEIRVLNEELVRKEKLAILGQLSGSMSHELRNPLGVMSNAVYFLKLVHADADKTTREYLDIINHEIDSSQRIITDLLDFARTKPPQQMAVMVGELMEDCLKKCAFPKNVNIQNEVPEELPALNVDRLQMGQVFQNLITNGIQAMPEGGELRISTRMVRGTGNEERGTEEINLGPRTLNIEPDLNFIEISVADSGDGISPENMKKLFQPLFTTKAKGIGLGLTVCRNLIEANGGRIEVKSDLGKGTTFTMILPVGG